MTTLAAASPADALVSRVRAAFPALARTHAGHPVAYLDGPGGTQVPQAVADAVADYLLRHNANTHWAYPTSAETDAIVADARLALADLLGARPTEIVFGANMTTLWFHLARALGRRMPAGPAEGRALGPGDEIVVTELDHHANIAPWEALVRERGVTLRMVRLDLRTFRLDPDDLARAIGPATRVVAVGAASNALGTITDVAPIAELARGVGALVAVDAVHRVPHGHTDVAAMGADFLGCSAYKFYGPHVGVLWGRAPLLAALDVPKVRPAPDTAPERLETGTANFEGIHGAAAAVDFLAGVGDMAGAARESTPPDDGRRARLARAHDALHDAGRALTARAWEGLHAIRGVTIHGPTPDTPRTPTLSITVGDHSARDVAVALAERGLFCSHGDFYATTVAERLGVRPRGLLRAGAACYTTMDEIERFLDAVREVARS
jgi:cysteine desulfurase family protein (TIGR01976 family)